MKAIVFITLMITLMYTDNKMMLAQTKDTNDAYLWLEDIEGEKALQWVKKQNEISDQAIASLSLFDTLKRKYTDVFNDKDKIAYPRMAGEYVYNLWQDDVHVRGLWRRMLHVDFMNGKTDWEEVIDIDALAKREGRKWLFDGAEWLAPDYNSCLIALSDGGTDENVIREFDTKTMSFVKDGFYCAASKGGITWIDAQHVLVSRDFGEGSLTNSGYPRAVRIWKRGTSMEEAKRLFETDVEHVGAFSYATYGDGTRHAFVYNAITFFTHELYYMDQNVLRKLDIPLDADVEGFHKNQLILALQSDWEVNGRFYKKGSLVSFDLDDHLSSAYQVNVLYEPDPRSSFTSIGTCKDFVILNISENVQNRLLKCAFVGKQWTKSSIDAPQFGSIRLTTYSDQSNHFYFTYSNFVTPTTLYLYTDKGLKEMEQLRTVFDAENFIVKQYIADSKDGTEVPYFIVHQKDIEYNGSNPTLIYAYGGFNNSSQPDYRSTVGIGWLEQGGVYVLANIRGGGEFGPAWHQSAIKDKKQNSYDDFYAVTEDLIARKITSPRYIGAFGWSNGGLMAGVVFTQRPELYQAVVSGAPLLDMKRYTKLLAGASWEGEYGNPDIPEEWAYIRKYSPYHNLEEGRKYPQVLFVTSTKDDRVHPGHARKMAAKMADMGHPYLYHETIEGGHGAASTNDQKAIMWAKIYTYLNMKLNSSVIDK